MLDSDIADVRQRYLFQLAHLCHVAPSDIDGLRVSDFYQLILGIDAYIKEVERANDAN